ncbi:Phage terminase, large subunit GpA [Fulvimarina manganoxydans]|uniref:Phage terminase, large subunit GpA n=1 Tax=Fulvimarina manganoxydans TaxID=937218 RepID=A0A1W1Y9R2_9HYPH|nr:terminase gpA endonuclease subunit [Fulvimarina manganoxydans]SMC32581.1 Phage terminase, large subunit GpA [Fulvimarina manganoxydans]
MSRFEITPDDRRACEDLAAPGAEIFLSALAFAAEVALVPNEPVDIVEWSSGEDGWIVLPTEVSERSGKIEWSPVQAAILLALFMLMVRQGTFKKPPRFGSSLMSAIIILYVAVHLGQSVIYYERSDDAAQDLHDKVLMPIMLASPKIRALMRPRTKAGVQDAWSDIILTNGASIQLRSASNNGSFRAIKGSVVLADEISSKEWLDRSKNSEGNKLGLARRRLQQYAAPLLYAGSTPTRKGACSISMEFERSDKRIYVMPCPHCETEIAFEPDVRRAMSREGQWGAGIRYTLDEDDLIDDAWYECGECHGHIEEIDKVSMMEKGRFRATNPKPEPGHVGFFAWAAYSTDPQSHWKAIAADHLKAERDPEKYEQDFVNLVLAQEWEPRVNRTTEPSELEARAVDYGEFDGPDWVEHVFNGVDVQEGNLHRPDKPPRVEIVTIGMGRNRRIAVLHREVISEIVERDEHTGRPRVYEIRPMSPECCEIIWQYLDREWTMASGEVLKARRTFIDCGYLNSEALEFASHPRSRTVTAVRGAAEGLSRKKALPPKESISLRKKRPFLFLGTQSIKDTIGRTISIPSPAPESWEFSAKLGADFYPSFLAEHEVEVRPGFSRWMRISETETGEALDCSVYALAAAMFEMQNNRRIRESIGRVEADAVAAALAARAAVEDPAPDEEEAGDPPSTEHTTDTALPPREESRVARVVDRAQRVAERIIKRVETNDLPDPRVPKSSGPTIRIVDRAERRRRAGLIDEPKNSSVRAVRRPAASRVEGLW